MKRFIKSDNNFDKQTNKPSTQTKKLKRTQESGHSYNYPITFNSFEEYKQWWKEDELYED